MIKAMSFCAGLKARRVSIICFALAACAVVCEGIEVKAVPEETARCGENVTLSCRATVLTKFLVSLTWVGNKTCNYNESRADTEVECESRDEFSHHSLNLTLINVMPVDQGTYTCKLRAEQGVKSAKTFLKVEECLGGSDLYIDQSYVTCRFDGVYPTGIIHWYRGDVNLTSSINPREEAREDQYGRYNLSSTIVVREGNPNEYRCSLWIPAQGKYLSMLSSGSMDTQCQTIWIMAAIMMVKFML